MNRQILMGAAALLMLGAGAAHAEDFTPKVKGQVMVNFRVTDVSPDANDAITTAAGGATGLHVNVSDSYVPTLGIAYFLSDNVALDLTLGTSNHTVKAVNSAMPAPNSVVSQNTPPRSTVAWSRTDCTRRLCAACSTAAGQTLADRSLSQAYRNEEVMIMAAKQPS